MRNVMWNQFPIKNVWLNPCFFHLWSEVTWAQICASLNHRKKMKAEPRRLSIPRKSVEKLELLFQYKHCWISVASNAAGVWTGIEFSSLKQFRTRIRIQQFRNRSGVGVWKCDSGHLCYEPKWRDVTKPTAMLHAVAVLNPVAEFNVRPFQVQRFLVHLLPFYQNLNWQLLIYSAAFPGSTIRYSLVSISTVARAMTVEIVFCYSPCKTRHKFAIPPFPS